MKPILVIPDIHNKITLADFLIRTFGKNHQIIFLGDYFDFPEDTAEDAKRVATWVKLQLENPENILLLGNHDIAYAFPKHPDSGCPGWTEAKQKAIHKVLGKKTLQSLPLHHVVTRPGKPPIVLSHAGFTIENLHGVPTPEAEGQVLFTQLESLPAETHILAIQEEEAKWRTAALQNKPHPFFYEGSKRGMPGHGGPFWLHSPDALPIPSLDQIVGHTRLAEPILQTRRGGSILLSDTGLKHTIRITDTTVEILNRESLLPALP